ncbi:MAG: HAMP domain-containing histidine kinase [Cyclobacteriaceae bacterium]
MTFHESSQNDAMSYDEIISNMNSGIDRIVNIVRSLNNFNQADQKSKGRVDLNKIIDETLILLRHEIHNKVVLEKKINDQLMIIGNEGQLYQVFNNIIMNAIHALGENGKIIIDLKKHKDFYVIKIKDNGIEINKEDKLKIFDPFFTTKDPGEGVGLGLSIVHQIILDHDAHISYDSEVNTGTTVSLEFQRATDEV